jgi:glycosyltransferase involved in cell wall biosynthesis
MRIAQVAPLAESVPPKLYGGTERVISWLTEELAWGTRSPHRTHARLRLMFRVARPSLVHSHLDWVHLPVLQCLGVPSLTTLHGRLARPPKH